MLEFPKDFLWGSATSSYQVEGDNANADWWAWEKRVGKENSGAACRHYELYEQDFDLARSLHHNTHRLSIEWSRVEPREGKFSEEEVKHYGNVIAALRKRDLEPMVTLHHFTNPIWFSESGGWEKQQSVERFMNYCEVMIRALAKDVRYWITINEPTVYLSHSYILGAWPPQAKSYRKAKSVHYNLIAAHIEVYRLIHKIYKELSLPAPLVSISQHIQAFVPCGTGFRNRFAANFRNAWYNFEFIDQIVQAQAADFIGANYYSRQLVDLQGWGFGDLVMGVCKKNHDLVKKNSLGWDIYPQGLSDVLLKLKKYKLPVIITENGICTMDDNLRWEYISAHLKSVHLAMENGVDIKGYLYWSLLDNFEWDKGFGPRFGLIDVDYATSRRTVRDSAKKFAEVCKTGVLVDNVFPRK